MSRSLLKTKSNNPSNVEKDKLNYFQRPKSPDFTKSVWQSLSLQLSCDAIQLSLSLIGSASHSFAVIPLLSCLITTIIWQSWPTCRSKKIKWWEVFVSLLTTKLKALLSYISSVFRLSERNSVSWFILFSDKRSEYTSQKKAFEFTFHLKLKFPFKNNCVWGKNKADEVKATFKWCIFYAL